MREGCGELAGNGGTMAEARMLKTDEAKEKSSNITSKRRKERSSRESRAQVDGAEKLRQAADRRVGQHSKKIADLLVANALKGDLPSAKMLVALAEHKKPRPEPRNPLWLRGIAQLAAEPEWVPPEGLVEEG
jgi:hypothetical protein